jgi:23S rRNA (cytosine1962-C5)-methyltransferase
VFSGAIKDLPDATQGEIVCVKSNQNDILGYGFFDPKNEIVCKIFEFTNTIYTSFNDEYWHLKLTKAYQMRKALIDQAHTNCYRLVHAEGDCLPGLIIDIYNHVVVVQVLHRGMEMIFDAINSSLSRLGFMHVYVKTKKSSQHIEHVTMPQEWIGTPYEGTIEVKEHHLKFNVDVEAGQKTGFFIDQRESRALVQQMANGKRVLNAFSYTGGFSVYALQGGASEVVSVDISKDAIAACDTNVKLNFSEASHHAIAEDCFDYLKHMDESFDMIILDPPAFAKNKRSVPNAARGYKEINLLAFKKIKPNGLLFTFSCSKNIDRDLFRKIVFGAAADSRRNVKILYQLTQSPDHPINIYHPEGEYLKGLVLWVE